MKNLITEPQLLVNDANGIYIAQVFCERYADSIKNKEELQDDINTCLEGPENEEYWDAWVDVMDNAVLIADNGQEMNVGNIGEGGDLWAIPEGYEYPEM